MFLRFKTSPVVYVYIGESNKDPMALKLSQWES